MQIWLCKHKLDYKRSERENGIQELKEKWQIRVDEDGTTHYGGASTLLSRRKQTIRVPERRGSVRVDKETGELIYKESGRAFIDPKTTAAVFLVKRNILCEWKAVLLTGAVAWAPMLLTDGMLQKKGFL